MTAILNIPMISRSEAIRFLSAEASVRKPGDELGATLRELLYRLNVGDEVGASGSAFRAAAIATTTLSDAAYSALAAALMHFQLYA